MFKVSATDPETGIWGLVSYNITVSILVNLGADLFITAEVKLYVLSCISKNITFSLSLS